MQHNSCAISYLVSFVGEVMGLELGNTLPSTKSIPKCLFIKALAEALDLFFFGIGFHMFAQYSYMLM